MTRQKELYCRECRKRPSEIEEYIEAAEDFRLTPDEYVMQEEGTYNPGSGLFWCTDCYSKIGMPLGTA